MKKIFNFAYDNILFLVTIFLLIFIPLYPKLPLVDVRNTWVYIRAEDFILFIVLLIYVFCFIKKKASLLTPLTIPILAFWIIGGLATIHGVLLFFPTLANVFPNVALLSYLRHIEYLSLFFVAFAGMRKKNFLPTIIIVLAAVFIAACLYGLGQKYASLPAFLTMNEEFAKGIPIQLSALGRVPSTFAGHYDFAAYLALLTPVFAALFFGVRNKVLKLFFAGTVLLGLLLMFMTVSRVSFFAVVVAIVFVVFVLKRKLVLLSIPVVLVLALLITFSQSSLFARFGNTVGDVDVLVNGKTGAAVGNVSYVPVSYFDGKTVKLQRVDDDELLARALSGDVQEATVSGITKKLPLPYELLPKDTLVPLVKASNISTGETLPQGTGYINLSLSPVKTRVGDFYYELSPNISANEVVNFHGNFLIKQASAYDLSFTTRFQGEWPHAVEAFSRNIFLGSGYGSVSLAIDNNFLRMLAEIGLLGTVSFALLFVIVGIYTYKSYKHIDSKLAQTFIVGVCAGIIGLSLNATLIDVFEASKVAFVLWLLIGITLATIGMESSKKLRLKDELASFAVSPLAMILYLCVVCGFLYTSIISQFFNLKDFTVFYQSIKCGSPLECVSGSNIVKYFLGQENTVAPFATLYFSSMYKFFWLNQVVYHASSILFNFIMALLVFMFARKVLKNSTLSLFAGFIFLISAATFQFTSSISTIGVILSSVFTLLSFLLYLRWEEKRNIIVVSLAVLSGAIALLFGVIGAIIPLLILSYIYTIGKNKSQVVYSVSFWAVSFPSLVFVLGRLSGFFMQKGDIISLLTTPWILFVNILSSIPVIVLGENAESIIVRMYSLASSVQLFLSAGIVVFVLLALYLAVKKKLFKDKGVRLLLFISLFFVIATIPFGVTRDVFIQSAYMSIVAWCLLLPLIFYGLYVYLKQNGTLIAVGFLTVGVITYSLFQLIQIQSSFKDNHTSSESVKNFLVSIDSLYVNEWSHDNVNFYFVDTPANFTATSQSQSSLSSVLWLIFKNPNLSVNVSKNISDAREAAKNTQNSYIFQFKGDTVSQVPAYVKENQ